MDKLSICTDVAKALRFLHNMGHMHRDIKSHNILLFADKPCMRAKLCDLGTVVKKPEVYDRWERRRDCWESYKQFTIYYFALHSLQAGKFLQEALGTSGWTAPEVYLGEYNEQADIFSFGVVMWEVFVQDTVENIFAGMNEDDFLKEFRSGKRLLIPDEAM